jgi:prolyl 4-hydroxylase
MNATHPSLEQISQFPRAYKAEGFVSAAEIATVLGRYDGPQAAAPGIAWDNGIAGISGELPVARDALLGDLAARIEAALGFANTLPGASFRFRRYALGDFHPAHVDCYAIAGHHLVATALIYLTDADEGGETLFPDAAGGPLVIAARRGRLALWFNYTPDGEIDHFSRHQSEALVAGEKATLAWFVYAPIACAASEPAVARLLETA